MSGRWVIVISLLCGCGTKAPVTPQADQAPGQQKKALEPRVPDETEVFAACCQLVRQHLKSPESATFLDDKHLVPLQAAQPKWHVTGALTAENGFGNRIRQTWGVILEWDPQAQGFRKHAVLIGDKFAFQTPEFEASWNEFARVTGNELGELPDEVAREIRNVQAAVEDAIKEKARIVFAAQWPDDPARKELKVRLNSDGLWEVTGKIERFDGSPRQDVHALVHKTQFNVTELMLGKRFLIGRPIPAVVEKPVAPKAEIAKAERPVEPISKVEPEKNPVIFEPKYPRRSTNTKQPKPTEEEESEAAKLLKKAGTQFRTDQWSSSKKTLQKIVEDFPNTKAGKDAAKQLEKFPKRKI